MKTIDFVLLWRVPMSMGRVLRLLCLVGLMGAGSLEAQFTKTSPALGPGSAWKAVGMHSDRRIDACAGAAQPGALAQPWLVGVKNLEKRHAFSPAVDALKVRKTQQKRQASPAGGVAVAGARTAGNAPVAGSNFAGNAFNGGAPPDNTLAISAAGYIVSVINCNVAYYDSLGNNLWAGSFWELFNDPTLTELIYDPIVLYDAQADRFVMIALHGFASTTSRVIVSFSKSGNPDDGWWFYQLTGNPLNNGCWLDYPKLGISNNEVYITGNLFNDLTGFSEAVIYQITKSDGYAGTPLNWTLWSNIAGAPITLVPAAYGQLGNYGPGLYFVSQSPGSGNSVDLYELTNDLGSNPQLLRTTVFKQDYEPSGYAAQQGSSVELITGDCRIQNAFFLDGTIHYVFQEDYQGSNFTGINYNRLQVNTLTNTSSRYGMLGFDYAYPAVASFGTSPTDRTVAISFLNSGATIYPEIRAVICDDAMTWSPSTLIKAGSTYVDAFENGNTVRWGDYTGIAYRPQGGVPHAWLSGGYGSTQSLFGTSYRCFGTWIAEIGPGLSVAVAAPDPAAATAVYPNPVVDLFAMEFQLDQVGLVQADIFDMTGQKVKTLLQSHLKAGRNVLTFNRQALASGSYLLTLTHDGRPLGTHKLIVQ
jgi:hypothetical protein